MPRVVFKPYDLGLEVPRGTSLLAAADEAAEMVPDDFFVGEMCEGRHECGNCAVQVLEGAENLSPMTDSEKELLATLRHGPDIRAACTTRVYGDVTVRIITPAKHDEQGPTARMQAHP